MPALLTVNIGAPRPTLHSDVDVTGIDKIPQDGPVQVRRPEPMHSGVAGDAICDVRHHGGTPSPRGRGSVLAVHRPDTSG